MSSKSVGKLGGGTCKKNALSSLPAPCLGWMWHLERLQAFVSLTWGQSPHWKCHCGDWRGLRLWWINGIWANHTWSPLPLRVSVKWDNFLTLLSWAFRNLKLQKHLQRDGLRQPCHWNKSTWSSMAKIPFPISIGCTGPNNAHLSLFLFPCMYGWATPAPYPTWWIFFYTAL